MVSIIIQEFKVIKNESGADKYIVYGLDGRLHKRKLVYHLFSDSEFLIGYTNSLDAIIERVANVGNKGE